MSSEVAFSVNNINYKATENYSRFQWTKIFRLFRCSQAFAWQAISTVQSDWPKTHAGWQARLYWFVCQLLWWPKIIHVFSLVWSDNLQHCLALGKSNIWCLGMESNKRLSPLFWNKKIIFSFFIEATTKFPFCLLNTKCILCNLNWTFKLNQFSVKLFHCITVNKNYCVFSHSLSVIT